MQEDVKSLVDRIRFALKGYQEPMALEALDTLDSLTDSLIADLERTEPVVEAARVVVADFDIVYGPIVDALTAYDEKENKP